MLGWFVESLTGLILSFCISTCPSSLVHAAVTAADETGSPAQTHLEAPASAGSLLHEPAAAPAPAACPQSALYSSSPHRATCCTDSHPAASSPAAPALQSPQSPEHRRTYPPAAPPAQSTASAADGSPTRTA